MKKMLFSSLLLVSVFINQGVMADNKTTSYCKPGNSCWPTEGEWSSLNTRIHGHLIKLVSPLQPCTQDLSSSACQKIMNDYKDPFFLETQPGSTQLTGWYKAWQSHISTYAVAAQSPDDIVEAIQFAKKHHIKIVVKGTGHDYLGRSNAPNSLLIWTHRMKEVTMLSQFIPHGCPKTMQSVPAVSAQAGVTWFDAYKKAAVETNQYVQGGGCLSVGVAGGFLQGGGFGSWSKRFGTGAANLLEAEVVTAEGKTLLANACQNTDLFWALKGGGGGTFGVVTKVTLKTHKMPQNFGVLMGSLFAPDDAAFKVLIKKFLLFYRDKLSNEHWGEQISIEPTNELRLSLSFVDIDKNRVEEMWHSFIQKWEHSGGTAKNIKFVFFKGKDFWDMDYRKKYLPQSVFTDDLGFDWWRANNSEVSLYIDYYYSRYLPHALLKDNQIDAFTEALYNASRANPHITLHFNKGLAGAAPKVLKLSENISMNPAVFKAMGLLIIADGQQYAYPQIPTKKPDLQKAEATVKTAEKAMSYIKDITPNAGTYPNEADYFEPNWQQSFWGENYAKLLEIKKKYDPDNIFSCHHCVGSETLSQ